jgi:DNA-binding NarL/FixJ family response regulator
METTTMRILVVDDHALFRDGIVSLLEASGHTVVGQAGDGNEAIDAALSLKPDVVLMDIAMPQCDGLEALRRIKAEAPEIKVVMLTVSEGDASLITAMRSGAQGYLLKSLSTEEFLASLDRLTRGELAISNQDINRIVKGLVGLVNQPPGPSRDTITEREAELLQLVADGLSNKAIAQNLSISENTVKYHMRQILFKLDAQNRTEAAILAVQAGLINKEDSS